MNRPLNVPDSLRSSALRLSRVTLALVAIGLAAPAHGACPAPFTGKECDGDFNNVEAPVCQTTGAISQIVCDLGLDGETGPTEAKFVSPTHTSFRAYGIAGDGEPFCCEFPVSDGCAGQTITLTVNGTTYEDQLDLGDGTIGLDMECSYSTVHGDDSDDGITGSGSTTNYDLLLGEGDDDHIYGYGGVDVIHGGDGEDLIYGGNGNDILYGDDDYDRISGGSGNDYIYGDDGNGGPDSKNDLRGNDGTDHLFGGPYADIICGDADSDFLYGYAGDDILYGSAAVGDYVSGGTDTNYCEVAPDAQADCTWNTVTSCLLSF